METQILIVIVILICKIDCEVYFPPMATFTTMSILSSIILSSICLQSIGTYTTTMSPWSHSYP